MEREELKVLGYIRPFEKKAGGTGYRVSFKEDQEKGIVRSIFLNMVKNKTTGDLEYMMISQVGEAREMTAEEKAKFGKKDDTVATVVKKGKKVELKDF
jgi:hypothetical protein